MRTRVALPLLALVQEIVGPAAFHARNGLVTEHVQNVLSQALVLTNISESQMIR